MSLGSDDPVTLGRWAQQQLPQAIRAVKADQTLSRWRPELLDAGQGAPRDVVDGWRGWLVAASFGDDFVYRPWLSPPNLYWDPVVTRLWNYHSVVTALVELWELGREATLLEESDHGAFLQAAPWKSPQAILQEVTPRLPIIQP